MLFYNFNIKLVSLIQIIIFIIKLHVKIKPKTICKDSKMSQLEMQSNVALPTNNLETKNNPKYTLDYSQNPKNV